MKKTILSLIVAVVGTLSCFAQDDAIATLNHGSSLTTYMGEDALAQAYNAAVDGDVITLSPGVFVGIDMNKAITLRGAGYKPMASNGYSSTQITGSMYIAIPSDATATFEMEGLDCLKDVRIDNENKCDVILSKSKFRGNVSGKGINLKATHCIFQSLLTLGGSPYFSTTFNCQSCVIGDAYCDGLIAEGTKMCKIIANNCIVGYFPNGSECLSYATLVNSIIVGGAWKLSETCAVHNCVGVIAGRTFIDLFDNIPDPSNVMIDGVGDNAYANIFKTLKSVSNPALYETFELTDVAKTTYLGEDGTQVGIYGGTAPFTLEPTNPQVTKFVVSSTTEGGQLKVKINVE